VKSQQSGFTLIELIIVIVILGILAAFALPRFADVSGNARAATINAAAGSMRSASAIAHSASLIAGAGPDIAVKLEGKDVDMKNGYPSLAGILDAAQISGGDFDTTTLAGTVTAKGATDNTKCHVVYAEAASASVAPIITVDPAGC
jgi:MSHA pilin protein MshA